MPYAIATWNGAGSPYRGQDLSQPSTTTDYDVAADRPRTVTAPDGSPTSYLYGDRFTEVIDANGHTTRTRRDVFGRTVQVEPPAGPDTTYEYDAADRLLAVEKGSLRTEIDYDYAGRKLSMDDPDMGTWTYAYDAAGNLTQQTDARGCSGTFTYDVLNRPRTKTYSGPGACGTTPSVTYSYDDTTGANDGVGRRTGMDDGSGSTTWVYDARGRTIEESKQVDGADTYVTRWSYYSNDQVQWMEYPDGERVTYTYHPQDAIDSVTSSLGTYVQATEYDAAGRTTLRTLGANTLRVDATYYGWTTANGRLQRRTAGTSGDPDALQDLRYTYDDMGNVETIEDYTAGNPQTQSFAYDAADRLTQAVVTGGSGGSGNYSEAYEYDAATGTLKRKGSVRGTDGTYTYDAAHPHAVSSYRGNNYGYDANGNMTSRSIGAAAYALTYDAENRLTRVTQGGSTIATFVYDGDGTRVKGTVDGTTTIYVGEHFEVELGPPVTPTPTPTNTPTSTPTNTPTATPTNTATPTPTNTATPPPTNTAAPTNTATPAPTNTATPTGTATPAPTFHGDRHADPHRYADGHGTDHADTDQRVHRHTDGDVDAAERHGAARRDADRGRQPGE